MIISIKISKFKRCCPLKIIVLVINFPDNFPKATRDAVKVIAPINDPKNNSTLSIPCPPPCYLKSSGMPFMQISSRRWCDTPTVGFLFFVLAHFLDLGFSYNFMQGEEFPFPIMLQ